jgi:hypothetical protein
MPAVVSSTPVGLLCTQYIPWALASGPTPCARGSRFPVVRQSHPSRFQVLACFCSKLNSTEIKTIFFISGWHSTPGLEFIPWSDRHSRYHVSVPIIYSASLLWMCSFSGYCIDINSREQNKR